MKGQYSCKRLLAIFFILGAVAIMLIRPILREQRLYSALADYKKAVDQGSSTPGSAPELSPKVFPVLLKWITDHSAQGDGLRRFMIKLRSINPWASATSIYGMQRQSRSDLAIVGFELLGDRGAAVLPNLAQLAQIPDDMEPVLAAMVCIGEASIPIALDFCASPDPNMRVKGARLLGGLGTSPNVSVPILLRLTTDRDSHVRSASFDALGEFPSPEVESHLLAQLPTISPEDVRHAAYAMHAAGTNTFVRLLDHAEASTSYAAKAAILASITFKDHLSKSVPPPLQQSFPTKIGAFDNHSVVFVISKSTPIDHEFFAQLRSNLVARGSVTKAEVLDAMYVKRMRTMSNGRRDVVPERGKSGVEDSPPLRH